MSKVKGSSKGQGVAVDTPINWKTGKPLSARAIEMAESVMKLDPDAVDALFSLLYVFEISRKRGKDLDTRAARQWYRSISPRMQECARTAFTSTKWAHALGI